MKKPGGIIAILFALSVGILLGTFIGRNTRGTVVDLSVDEAQNIETTVQTIHKLNINAASADQLDVLPGIGKTLADRIIAYRMENGPFRSVDELLFVDGIGEKTLHEIQHLIDVGE